MEICKDEDLLRKELYDTAVALVEKKHGKDACRFDFDWGDTGDETIGIDAYVYFPKSYKGELNDVVKMEFIPDGGVELDVVRDCCNIIAKVVEPDFDFDEMNSSKWMEYDYQEDWVRVYICLTVPNMVKED